MSLTHRITSRAWIFVLVCSLGFLAWTNVRRIQRVDHVTVLTEAEPALDNSSASGYAGGIRHLIVPEHNSATFQWIAQAQQMFANRQWHVQHVDYDNAPFGRDVRSTSLYRWWIGAVAMVDRAISGAPIGVAVQRAALFADPLLQILWLISVTLFVARRFGGFAAAMASAAMAFAFPFGGAFVAGQLDDQALLLGCVLWSLLPLIAAVSPAGVAVRIHERGEPPTADSSRNERAVRRWFLFAGIAGGIAMWADVATGVPILIGVMAGGLLEAWLARDSKTPSTDTGSSLPWRHWAAGGGATCLFAVLVDRLATMGDANALETIHPLYGLAWLGAGELLARATTRMRGMQSANGRRAWVMIILAILAVVALPVTFWVQHSAGFLVPNLQSARLAGLPNAPVAKNLLDWVWRDGFNVTLVATLLPLFVLVPAVWLLVKPGVRLPFRGAVGLATGAAAVALVYAMGQLRWWATLDCALLAVLVTLAAATAANSGRAGKAWWSGGTALVFAAGLLVLVPRTGGAADDSITKAEAESLIERDLAHWLSARAANHAVVLAPPELAAALSHYGGVRALSTPYRENMAGFAAAVRIAGATLPDEAYALVRRREITHILVPSWDSFLDEYARLGTTQVDKSFMGLLHQWLPPRWLKPVPYQVPAISGLEGRSLAIFEVVDVQDDATGLSHLAEYFVEMGDLDSAAKVADALAHWFSEDPTALVARAVVEAARHNSAGFKQCLDGLLPQLSAGVPESLSWEHRVILSIVLAEAKRYEKAREYLQRSFAEIDDAKLRSLTTGTLFRMQVLAKALGVQIAEPRLRVLALELIPTEMREQLVAVRAGAAR